MERKKVESEDGIIYKRENMERVLKRIREEVDERKGEKGWLIGGDFNARTSEEEAMERMERKE